MGYERYKFILIEHVKLSSSFHIFILSPENKAMHDLFSYVLNIKI